MQDKELYYQLLGLCEPWRVTVVEVDFKAQKVDVFVEWPAEKMGKCPDCGKEYSIHDYRSERCWRHLDTMQFQTVLHCRLPRIKCEEHGVKSIDIPWSERNSRFTSMYERFAIDVLQGCGNQTKARELLRLSWDEVHLIQSKGVQRGLWRRSSGELRYIGVDEKSFLRGHQYATVVCDLEQSRVLDVSRDRKAESLGELLGRLPAEQREGIKAVAMDMWEPFMRSVRALLPSAEIVHDKFHIAKYLGEAVDKVRKAENRILSESGDNTLKGTKYLWLTNPSNWLEKQKALFKELKDKGLKVGKAWAIKEMFTDLWRYRYEKPARDFFARWYWWATHARLKPMADAAKVIKRHLDNILTYLKHRITNATAEGLNSKIQLIKSSARGFRNFENFRIAILFHCGQLDMYPEKSAFSHKTQ